MKEIPAIMRAVVFDGTLQLVEDFPVPTPAPGWALIRVRQAGICKTDMEIVKGYLGFRGILGHEFTGMVVKCDTAPSWVGKSVVGEINAACDRCAWCLKGLRRHCPERLTLGIVGLNGCMAEYCMLPVVNLVEIPDNLSEEITVLTEPLSAACEILEQVKLAGDERAVVLGDGRLGILCAWVLMTRLSDVTLVGHHLQKLDIAAWRHLRVTGNIASIRQAADIVVEATGSHRGLVDAIRLCRPRGTIILKSTIADVQKINLAPVVINEISIVGSRCGQFRDGLALMTARPDMPLARLITARYPLTQAEVAFERASRPDMIKTVINPDH